jgi:hypothetical protein
MVASILEMVAKNDRPSLHFCCAFTIQVLEQIYNALRQLGQSNLTTVVLLSRDRMCSHPDVRGAPFQIASDRCKVSLGRKTNQNRHAEVAACQFYEHRQRHGAWSSGPISDGQQDIATPTVRDIEDLSTGHQACAYYGQSQAAHVAIKAGHSVIVCGTMKLLTDVRMMQTR